jgi:two-component system CheB/CheR fusion protein
MTRPSHIVAIGASAGGLEALKHLFSVSLKGTPLAFVIVQHISPNHKSLMPELLSKVVDIPVDTIKENEEIRPGHIYLIPAGQNVRMQDWRFALEPTDPLRRVLNLPINIFFASLAETHKDRAIGVILSGTGSDGTLGLLRIHEVGGLTVVQDPESAQFDGMPRAALDSVRTDFVLRPQEILPEVIRYCDDQRNAPQDSMDGDELLSDEDTLHQIFSILQQKVNVDYSQYKVPTLARRIQKRMKLSRIRTLVEYADLLTIDGRECEELAKEFLINVTQFFRDPESFESLYSQVILPMVRDASTTEPVRVWVPACATGEEAYTIAILFLEAEAELNKRIGFKIFATDLDQESIQIASRGSYPNSVMTALPEKFRVKYFIKKETTYSVEPIVRERILFAPQDLIHSPPFRKLNLISCRNVLIYFQHALQQAILRKFHYSLVDGGYLFLGSSESLSETKNQFDVLHAKAKIFRKIRGLGTTSFAWSSAQASVRPATSVPPGLHVASQYQYPTSSKKSSPVLVNRLLETLCAPGVILSRDLQIQHFVGDVSAYFAHPIGEATFDAHRLIRPEYRLALRSAVSKLLSGNGEDVLYFEVREHGASARDESSLSAPVGVRSEQVPPILDAVQEGTVSDAEEEALQTRVVLKAQIFFDPIEKQSHIFIGFLKAEKLHGEINVIEANKTSHSLIQELEKELDLTRERLQNTIEALEASNEELHSTNEELLSANEELQSTNEELQSVNEELHTVNSEHQMKIEELIELNSDLDNLLANTDIGVLFLDSELKVSKYTQAARKYVHVMERDVGRSIRHLALRVHFPAFAQELETVRRDGHSIETEVQVANDEVILVRIVPYVLSDSVSRGVTVIFINISYQNELLSRLRHQNHEAVREYIGALPLPAFLKSESGQYIFVNQAMQEIAGTDLMGWMDDKWIKSTDELGRLKEQERQARLSIKPVSEVFSVESIQSGGPVRSLRRVVSKLFEETPSRAAVLVGYITERANS